MLKIKQNQLSKKCKSFLLGLITVLILCIGCIFTSFAGQIGDIDNDGKITALDARIALRISARLESPTEAQQILADVDGDNKITASDARTILRVAARLETLDITVPEETTEEEPSTEENTTVQVHTHNYILTDSSEGTCTNTGLDIYSCTGCDSKYEIITPMAYHSTPYGVCEYCSEEIYDSQIQVTLEGYQYQKEYEELESYYDKKIESNKSTIQKYMSQAGVSSLYSKSYYLQEIESVNNEIVKLQYQIMDSTTSDARRELCKKQLDEKNEELTNLQLLLDAIDLSDEIDKLKTIKEEKLTTLSENHLENISSFGTAKCMLCCGELPESSNDGFCDKCRLTLDEKTIKIAEENTRYYNAQIEIYIEHLNFLDRFENLEDIEDILVNSLKVIGINSVDDMVEFLNTHPSMLTYMADLMGSTEEEFKEMLDMLANRDEYFEADLNKQLEELKNEHIEILNIIELKYN